MKGDTTASTLVIESSRPDVKGFAQKVLSDKHLRVTAMTVVRIIVAQGTGAARTFRVCGVFRFAERHRKRRASPLTLHVKGRSAAAPSRELAAAQDGDHQAEAHNPGDHVAGKGNETNLDAEERPLDVEQHRAAQDGGSVTFSVTVRSL